MSLRCDMPYDGESPAMVMAGKLKRPLGVTGRLTRSIVVWNAVYVHPAT